MDNKKAIKKLCEMQSTMSICSPNRQAILKAVSAIKNQESDRADRADIEALKAQLVEAKTKAVKDIIDAANDNEENVCDELCFQWIDDNYKSFFSQQGDSNE